ncbi:hypothetical protein FGO68_gene10741 [Halteria grandinella]|uniref:Uncharacterized protein n=1 Tax=Halteria grandinella TaxID=5974 RepID=A0A8J8T9A2_HALGN|nr:hypothetical protein FGO68_gene10741 [Halteria grandinella]
MPFAARLSSVPAFVHGDAFFPFALKKQERAVVCCAIDHSESVSQAIKHLPIVHALLQGREAIPLHFIKGSPLNCPVGIRLCIQLIKSPIPAVRSDIFGKGRFPVAVQLGSEAVERGVQGKKEHVQHVLFVLMLWNIFKAKALLRVLNSSTQLLEPLLHHPNSSRITPAAPASLQSALELVTALTPQPLCHSWYRCGAFLVGIQDLNGEGSWGQGLLKIWAGLLLLPPLTPSQPLLLKRASTMYSLSSQSRVSLLSFIDYSSQRKWASCFQTIARRSPSCLKFTPYD